MRITHEMLNKVAQDTVNQRVHSNRLILAAYLHGSVLLEDPLIGGTTDIDLFFIHDGDFPAKREVIRITDEVHLDIAHLDRGAYRQLRELRRHPWWGPTLYGCKILHDPQHFLDFIQASVRGQYERSDHILGRARPLAEFARQAWFAFDMGEKYSEIQQVRRYLQALESSANAVALLSGNPLTERRFLLDFSVRAQMIDHPGISAGLLGLLGTRLIDDSLLRVFITHWKDAFDYLNEGKTPPALSSARRCYYLRAFDGMLASERPEIALWPLLNSWTKMIVLLPEESPPYLAWREACAKLDFIGDGFVEKTAALDSFLDLVEGAIEKWAQDNGA